MTIEAIAQPKIIRGSLASTLTERRYNSFHSR
jgi:hypothetical protein